MNNRLVNAFVLIFAFISCSGFAQSMEEIESKMDQVKLDENYIFGESLNEDESLALNNALLELVCSSNEIREEQGLEIIKVDDLSNIVNSLISKKGKRYTVLVFLPFKQMLSLKSQPNKEALIENPSSQETFVPPIKEDIVVSQGEQNGTQAELATLNEQTYPQQQSEINSQASPNNPWIDDIIQKLCGQDNWVEIRGFLVEFKKDGKIKSNGNVQSYKDVPEDACAILMDKFGGILSILSPKKDKKQINFRTNLEDKVTNYDNCEFIVWFK